MISDTHQQLSQLADTYLGRHAGEDHLGQDTGPGPGGARNNGEGGLFPTGPGGLPTPPLGGSPGYFQIVQSDGTATALRGGSPELPVTAQALTIARSGKGRFYSSATVHHDGAKFEMEVLTVADPHTHTAVQVGLQLTSIDNVLSGLRLTYALVVGGGVLLAGLIGTFVARVALRPINRFSDLTEQVTSALHRPRRLDERGAVELRRLATSFNQTLDALERSIQAQQHLIADASHELRTPMAALRSNIQIFLEADRLPEGERGELQDAILAELDELTKLVSDVLDLARGAAPSEHIEPVELDMVVREAVTRAQRRAPQLQFDTELEPTVIANAPERVARAVANVIDNASKWSPPDGRVQVSLSEGVLTVRDHGPGFKQSDLGHVFDRFYRADEARRLPGSGLGLAIVRQAAEAYGGSAIASNAPEGGAVVEVVFGSRPATGVVS
jgi:two-component system sensor histidine kinase MprB